MGKKMTAEELVQLLNGGGWWVRGRRETCPELKGCFFVVPLHSVVNASVVGEKLLVTTEVRTFELPSDKIFVVKAGVIEVRCEYMRRQQRKKVDGGGFVEVPTIGVALRLNNPAMEEAAKKVQAAEERKKKEERLRREEEERHANQQAFGEKLTKDYLGRKVVRVSVASNTITVEFEDGSDLFVSLAGGDIYDAWLNVNEISLCTFEFNRE